MYMKLKKNKFNKEIAIGITTFLRDESLFRLIRSILAYYPEIKIYIADQGKQTPYKKILYRGLVSQGHYVKFIPYDSGISMNRKVLKDVVKEQYLVYMEDDFEVTKKTNLYKMKEILDENPEIGIAGGNLEGCKITGDYSFYLDYADDKLCYFPVNYLVDKKLMEWNETSSGIRFIRANIVSDFTMWRKEVPNIFDVNVKTIEHTDVYLLVKYKTKYGVAFTPESEIKHVHDKSCNEYNQFRGRKKDLEYLKKYWNVIDFFTFDKSILLNLEAKSTKSEIIVPKSEPIKPITLNKQIINDSNPTGDITIGSLFQILNQSKIRYVIMGITCLDAVKFHELKHDLTNISLEVYNESDKNELNKICDNFNNNNLNKKILNINVVEKKRDTKLCRLYNENVLIPYPIIPYLNQTFGKEWQRE